MRTKPSELMSPPGSWRYLIVRRVGRVPVDRGWRDFLAVLVEDADLLFRQIVRIRLHLRDQILLDQRRRHGPERIEIDLGRLGLHDRRLAVDLADAGRVMRIDDAVLDRLDRGGRNIDHHEARRRDRRNRRAAARYWSRAAAAGPSAGTLSSVKHFLVDDARLAQAVAGLKALDRRLDKRIEHLRRCRPQDRDRRKRRAAGAAPAPPWPSNRSSARRRPAPGSSRPGRRYPGISRSPLRSPRGSRATAPASSRA